MPEGPAGGPRPLASSSVVVYSRFKIGGDVHENETEKLQTQAVYGSMLSTNIENNTPIRNADVRFHPAGFIVGVEVNTNKRGINRELVDNIVGRSKRFLEAQLNQDAELDAADRKESAVEIRAK